MGNPSRKLALHVAVGTAAGLAYSAANRLFDLQTGFGTLPSALAPLHTFVDLVLPVMIGAVVGLAYHALQLRATLVEVERRRSEDLRQRLAHTERDQAVWVLAAAVLHEVKNPLHALGLLLDDVGNATAPADRERVVERARTHVGRIADRLAELATLSAASTPGRAPLAIGSLAREIADDIAPLARDVRVDVAVVSDDGTVAAGDASYARVILQNLVENAIDAVRAGARPGRVMIAIARAEGNVEVRVSDDGPGLDVRAREGLFEPLRSKKAGGIGLGLSISRKLARAMNGDLRYEDGDASGFVFCLPRNDEASE